jgi:hypothetical protein
MADEDTALPPDLQANVDQLDRELEEIGTEHPAQLEGSPTPPIISHYTDDAGLRGILQSGKLWVTDVFYLNDPSELKYGVSIACETLARAALGGTPEQQIFARDFREYGSNAVESVAHYFVCSFSTNGNDLGQWRAYANNGQGYSIGFDGGMLEQAFCKQPDGTPIRERMAFPISYDERLLGAIYRRLVNKVLPLVSAAAGVGLTRPVLDQYNRALRISLALQVYRTALFFKHPAYFSEQEYRFMQINPITNPPTGLSFRSRPHMLLRYLEFDWKTLNSASLKQIIIGPGTEPRMGGRFAYDCLKAYFPVTTLPVSVVPSAIPYRPS